MSISDALGDGTGDEVVVLVEVVLVEVVVPGVPVSTSPNPAVATHSDAD